MVDETIPYLVDENMNTIITRLPFLDEISASVFALNKYSAQGPDVFRVVFHNTYWDIIKENVSNVILEFLHSSWILLYFNSNTIVVIPKIKGADTLDLLRPIGISNFKFKLISKIIADRLATLISFLVCQDQHGFNHGRHIHDCNCLASKAIDLFVSKAW